MHHLAAGRHMSGRRLPPATLHNDGRGERSKTAAGGARRSRRQFSASWKAQERGSWRGGAGRSLQGLLVQRWSATSSSAPRDRV